MERGPPVVVSGIETFRIRPESEVTLGSVGQRDQTRALYVLGSRHADEFEHGRHEVDPADLRRDPQPASDLTVRRSEQEGHLHRGVVDEEPVGSLPVPSQTLAVVADQDEQGVLSKLVLVQPVQQLPDQGIGEQHFCVVRSVRITADPGRPGLRRLVGPMRVVEMDPGEEAFVLHFVHPGERRVEDLVSGALHAVEADALELAEVEVVVVALEPLIQTPAGIHHEGGHETARPIPRVPKHFRERLGVLAHVVAAVVPDPVEHRVGPGEHRGVGGQRERNRGGCLLEEHALGGDPAERGRFDAVVAVLAEVPRREGVERHHHHVQRPDGVRPAGDPGTARASEQGEANTGGAEPQAPGREHVGQIIAGEPRVASVGCRETC